MSHLGILKLERSSVEKAKVEHWQGPEGMQVMLGMWTF
jgi:hypothetical protein